MAKLITILIEDDEKAEEFADAARNHWDMSLDNWPDIEVVQVDNA
jgi:hypothetical protein